MWSIITQISHARIDWLASGRVRSAVRRALSLTTMTEGARDAHSDTRALNEG